MKSLRIIPDGLDRPLAFAVHIAQFSSVLIETRRNQREPIRERLGKNNSRWKFRSHGAKFINERPVSVQLNGRKPLAKLASLVVARLNSDVSIKIHIAQLTVLPDGNQPFAVADSVENERLLRQEISRSID